MSSLGLKLIASLLDSDDLGLMTKVNPDYLKPTEKMVYEFVTEHVMNYGKYPKVETIISEESISIPKAKEVPSFYLDKVKERYFTTTINKTMMSVQGTLEDKKPMDALNLMAATVADLLQQKSGKALVDFRDAIDLLKESYKLKNSEDSTYGVKSGWVYLDNRMGALEPGDMLSIIGRPAQGKTMALIRMAYHAWFNQELPVLVVTPEMKPIKIVERLAAIHTRSELTPIAHGTYTSHMMKTKVYDKLEVFGDKDQPFWVVDGADCRTIEDLFLLTRQLEPAAVYYDGAYLMKHRNPRLSKWERIASTALGLKELGSTLDIPVVASYQFSKEAAKKAKGKKSDSPGLEDIYGSDEIAQLSSIVVGFLQQDNIASAIKKTCTLLKGRGGEMGQWDINWLFDTMNFDEIGVSVEDIDSLPDGYVHFDGCKKVSGQSSEDFLINKYKKQNKPGDDGESGSSKFKKLLGPTKDNKTNSSAGGANNDDDYVKYL